MIQNQAQPVRSEIAAQGEVASVVQMGDQRGRLLGFPTANLYPTTVDRWERGVYAGVAHADDQVWWPAAVNVGARPTFTGGTGPCSMEVHLIGFDGDIYGQMLTVRLIERLRDEVRFESVEALVDQLRHDVQTASSIVDRVGSRLDRPR
ncbi:MAG: riboflavin kinase [Ilumatobacteraceae bacterium]